MTQREEFVAALARWRVCVQSLADTLAGSSAGYIEDDVDGDLWIGIESRTTIQQFLGEATAVERNELLRLDEQYRAALPRVLSKFNAWNWYRQQDDNPEHWWWHVEEQ